MICDHSKVHVNETQVTAGLTCPDCGRIPERYPTPQEDDAQSDLPLWTVGRPYMDDWLEIRAPDRREAISAWMWARHGKEWCADCPHKLGVDDVCRCHPGLGVTRQE